jgi:hypothetical protein
MNEAEEVVARIGKELDIPSPEAVQATMKVYRLATDETEGAFIRYVEGQSLADCKLLERIVLKKQVARDMVLRALVGDRDGHALNYKLANGRVRPFDRNLTDFLDQEDWLKDYLAQFPNDTAEQATLRAMTWRLRFAMTHKERECYKAMADLMEHMVYEDFAETIEIVKSWNRQKLAALIGDTFGKDTDRILDIMEARIRVMDKVFQNTFDPVEKIIEPGSGEIPTPEAALEEEFELPLAA